MSVDFIEKLKTIRRYCLVVVPGVSANPDYFTALQSVYGPTTICLTCHTSTDGPPPFTDYGTLFSNNASHVTDPKGVLEAIGSPLTPTPTPEATPTPTPTTMEPQLVLTLTPGQKRQTSQVQYCLTTQVQSLNRHHQYLEMD